jgi:translation initiation factor 3 subunit D
MPPVAHNADGWGPVAPVDADKFNNIPYAPFSKGDRLGRAADWANTGRPGRYNQQWRDTPGGMDSIFNFKNEINEDSFHTVDTKPTQRPQHFGPRRHLPNTHRRDTRAREASNALNSAGLKAIRREQHQEQRRKTKRYGNHDNRYDPRRGQTVARETSVDIGPEWHVIENGQINFPILLKLKCEVGAPETLKECGEILGYDKSFERLSTKTGRDLARLPKSVQFFQVTTSEDPVMQKIAASDPTAKVFATDQVVSVLMAAPRSVYSWDIVATKTPDGKIFLDKRANASVDFLTVNETANDPPSEEVGSINNVASLMQEATFINLNFSQQMLDKKSEPHAFGSAHPFIEPGTESTKVGYRYRKFSMDATDIVVRAEVDSYIQAPAGRQFVKFCALNEFDSRVSGGVDWRRKLDTQKGAVLASELKNNSNKLAQWATRANMAGADHVKMGFVSRTHPKDSYNHKILKVEPSRAQDFYARINLDMSNCWGILKGFCDLIDKQEPGKYVFVKDANKPLVRIYSVPMDAFDRKVEERVDDEADEEYDDAIGL